MMSAPLRTWLMARDSSAVSDNTRLGSGGMPRKLARRRVASSSKRSGLFQYTRLAAMAIGLSRKIFQRARCHSP